MSNSQEQPEEAELVIRKCVKEHVTKGEYPEALEVLQREIKKSPYNRGYLLTMSHILYMVGQFEAALDFNKRVLTVEADDEDAMSNMGVILGAIGARDDSIEPLREAVLYNSTSYPIWINLASALYKANKFLETIYAAQCAMKISPDAIEPHYYVGSASFELRRYRIASIEMEKTLELDPKHVPAMLTLLNLYDMAGNHTKADEFAQRIIEIDSDQVAIINRQACALLDKGDYAGSRALFDKHKEKNQVLWQNSLFLLQYHPGVKGPELYRKHQEWGQFIDQKCEYIPMMNWAGHAELIEAGSKGVQYGIISSDLREHSVAYFAKGLIDCLREYGRLTIFFTGSITDRITEAFKKLPGVNWVDCCKMKTLDLLKEIRTRQVGVLFDLNGHTADNRLDAFALRAAPIQVSYIGYPCTTGLSTMDFRIVDKWTDPVKLGYSNFCTENLVRLNSCFLSYTPPDICLGANFYETLDTDRAIARQSHDKIIIGCLNNINKITDDDLELWQRILSHKSTARLVLKHKRFGTPAGQASFVARCVKAGINPDQLLLHYVCPETTHHLMYYNDIDFAIDPIHYNGTTTTCEAMVMGVPVVTLYNPAVSMKHASNVGGSLLTAVSTLYGSVDQVAIVVAQQIRQNICSTKDRYVARCWELMDNMETLFAMSGSKLSKLLSGSVLCNQERYRTELMSKIEFMIDEKLKSYNLQ